MNIRKQLRFRLTAAAGILSLSLVWLVPSAYGGSEAPQPNALVPIAAGGNTGMAPVGGIDITKSGPAASMHGDPLNGRALFAQNCASCHGDRGTTGIANPGSDDGTVPTLNPIDPGFLADSSGDPSVFASDLDLFLQHGSTPSGPSPSISMIAWGDHKLLTQQQLADIEAYVMMMNGVYWPDRWAPPVEVRMTANQDGNNVTYAITLVNHSTNPIGGVTLSDTVPANMTIVGSGVPGFGQNPGGSSRKTASWLNLDGISQGGTLGPFMVAAQLQSGTLQPNVAQVQFNWTDWAGNSYSSTAVSNPTLPGQPAAAPTPAPTPAPSASPSASAAPSPSPSASAAPSPAAPSASDIAAGKQVFQSYCVACHGPDAAGGIKLGTATSADLRWSALGPMYGSDTSLLARAILTGKDEKGEDLDPAMPRWQGQLTDAQVSSIITYLHYGTS